MAIEDEYVAYCLDQATAYFGTSLEAELNKVEGKTDADREHKRKLILDRYLFADDKKPQPGRFADPAATK